MRGSYRFAVAVLPLVWAGCSAPPAGRHLEAAREEQWNANFHYAYLELQAALAEHPEDADLQRRVREARIVYLLDLQRSLVFDSRETEALAVLARVLTLDPENPVALQWQAKARHSLGSRLVLEGQEELASERLEEAQRKFQAALDYMPGNERALAGLRDVAELYRDQRQRAAQHYRNAVRARDFDDWKRVSYHAKTSAEVDPAHPDAPQLAEIAARKVAEEHRTWAVEQEKLRNWAAAARAHKLAAEEASALRLDWASEAKKSAETAGKEAEALQLMSRAETRIASASFIEARQLLDQADKLCTQERTELNDLRRFLDQEELRWGYETARLEELDHKYEDALATYRRLGERDPQGPAADRARVLEERLQRCAELYTEIEAALAASAHEKAIGLLRELTAIHPRYRDARTKLLELTASSRDARDRK